MAHVAPPPCQGAGHCSAPQPAYDAIIGLRGRMSRVRKPGHSPKNLAEVEQEEFSEDSGVWFVGARADNLDCAWHHSLIATRKRLTLARPSGLLSPPACSGRTLASQDPDTGFRTQHPSFERTDTWTHANRLGGTS